MALASKDELVIMAFDPPTNWIQMSAGEARELASELLKVAEQIEQGS
jgi:hypothetical protein